MYSETLETCELVNFEQRWMKASLVTMAIQNCLMHSLAIDGNAGALLRPERREREH